VEAILTYSPVFQVTFNRALFLIKNQYRHIALLHIHSYKWALDWYPILLHKRQILLPSIGDLALSLACTACGILLSSVLTWYILLKRSTSIKGLEVNLVARMRLQEVHLSWKRDPHLRTHGLNWSTSYTANPSVCVFPSFHSEVKSLLGLDPRKTLIWDCINYIKWTCGRQWSFPLI
jgi:hypothetical protein